MQMNAIKLVLAVYGRFIWNLCSDFKYYDNLGFLI